MASANTTTLRGQTIGLIGCGTMGSAIAHGLLTHGVSRAQLRGAEAKSAQRRRVARALRIRLTDDAADVYRRSAIVVLAVKPQELTSVLVAARATDARPLVISIAAGVTTRVLERRLGRVAVIRAMPNTAARLGASITALSRGRFATARHLRLATAVFQSVGETVAVPERLMDAVSAVSGSGPAYFFWLTHVLADAGRRVGLPSSVAAQLARQTAIGSAALLARETTAPQELIAQVASKRGTTEAALKMFARRRLAGGVAAAVQAATRRARQLSRLAGR